MTIAGHTFDALGRCSCGRTWRGLVDRRLEWVAGARDLAHVGALNGTEAMELAEAWEAEQARVWAATFGSPVPARDAADDGWVMF
jgi:hypothetical protein